MTEPAPQPPGSEFDNFRALTQKLLAVPKSAVPKHVVKKRTKPSVKGKKTKPN